MGDDEYWLEAVAGPLAGQLFPLVMGEVTIGREPDNTIALMDGALSRHHCLLRQDQPGVWLLVDRESRNGTFLNDEAVSQRRLAPGDRIRLGKSILRFRAGRDTQPEHSAGIGNAGTGIAGTGNAGSGDAGAAMAGAATAATAMAGAATAGTIIIRQEESRYLAPGHRALPQNSATFNNLEILARFSREAAAHKDPAELEAGLLDAAKRATGADRAVFWRTGDELTATLSRTIRDQVLEDGVAVLCNNVAGDDTLATAQSLVTSQVSSVMAIPVALRDRMFGILHVDSRHGARFEADQLEFLTALGSIAAVVLDNLSHFDQLKEENSRLKQELNIQFDMVGQAPAMQPVYQFISRVAPREATVLIWGESGTGKELVARAIHANSPRANKPFVALNCAAITETLLESELFGHEKGAFTGAVVQKRGKLEMAEGGTVFLDEVGELALTLQAKLLRVLQLHEYERVGGTKTIKADIRVVTATNRDLKEASKRREFREDLYYRLNVVSIKLPALRERREDIPMLAQFFAERFSEKIGRRVTGVSPKARAYMLQYDWPGNVRELENTIERAVVLGMADTILPEDLPESLLEGPNPTAEPESGLHEIVREAKKRAVLQALDQTGGNQSEAAKLLGVHAVHLSRLMKTLGLR